MSQETMSKLAIPDDAPTLAEIWNRLYLTPPPMAPKDFEFSTHRYLLAFSGATPAGYLKVNRSRREADPEGKCWAYLTLAPPHEEAAVHVLYRRLETLPGVRVVFTMTHESSVQRQRTLTSLGYHERLRSYGANLRVAAVDLSTFSNPEARLEREGIRLHTRTELRHDTDHFDKLYALYLESNRDLPEVGHSDTMSRAQFSAHLAREDALPDAFYIAAHEGNYIGYSELFRGSPEQLRQETTAVLAGYRRRGVALALKLRGLAYAQSWGYEHINTGMASNNEAMVALNTRLGFVPQEAFITFSKNIF